MVVENPQRNQILLIHYDFLGANGLSVIDTDKINAFFFVAQELLLFVRYER